MTQRNDNGGATVEDAGSARVDRGFDSRRLHFDDSEITHESILDVPQGIDSAQNLPNQIGRLTVASPRTLTGVDLGTAGSPGPSVRKTRVRKNIAAAAADPTRWKVEPRHDGSASRTARYAGCGRPGGQPVAVVDDRDLAAALDELVTGRARLAEAYMMRGRGRSAAIRSAIAKIALAGRFIDALILRRGGECPDTETTQGDQL